MSDNLLASLALLLAEFKLTKARVAKKPIMEITTKSSIKVNPLFLRESLNSLSLSGS